MLELVLLRHPETQWNKDKLLQGQSDIPALDPTVPDDLVQAIIGLGPVAAVYTSDLRRCSEPALALYRKIAVQTSSPVLYCETPLLRERNFGALEGKPYHALGCDSVASVGQHLYHRDIPDGESRFVARKRAGKALYSLLQYQDPELITVVVAMTHGCFMNDLLTELEGTEEPSLYRPMGNLSGCRVQMTGVTLPKILSFPR